MYDPHGPSFPVAVIGPVVVRQERASLRAALVERGMTVPESQGNFLLATAPAEGPRAREIFSALERHGVLVRYFDEPCLDDKIRISIGTPDQNRRLVDALTQVLA